MTAVSRTDVADHVSADDQMPVALMVRGYEVMQRIRCFDNKAYEAHRAGLVRGGIHSYVGQEAIATGVSLTLDDRDWVNSYHRGHGHSIAKGTDPEGMMKELLGRVGGTSRGKGGSMHIADFGVGIMGSNGIVADGAPMAVGVGHSIRLLGHDRVSVVYFGDGAINRGPLMESMNWAAAFNLPVLFVCEDNQFAASTRTSSVSAGPGFAARAESMGVQGSSVDGNDLQEVWAAARKLVKTMRAGGGPGYIYAPTYRHFTHNIRSPFPVDEDERKLWLSRDPVVRTREQLIGRGVEAARLDRIETEQEQAMVDALEAAKAAPEPDPAEAYTDVQDFGGPQR